MSIVSKMAYTLQHRGPDDSGAWVDPKAGIAMGHRRLSVIDLSNEGRQPMFSDCGRYIASYNGEIYNFKELRKELENIGYTFRGHSDTEVMVNSISQWGVESAIKKFRGMFAFAVWDRSEGVLYLTRDRIGEKPLYYGWSGGIFFFASELKALTVHPGIRCEIDRNSLSLYLRHNYIPAPFSIYKGIFKLIPGTYLRVDGMELNNSYKPLPYWSLREAAERGSARGYELSETESIERLNNLLRNSVSAMMEADVPLGVFLSGGIDSSTVVAIMQEQNISPVKTFTLGFYEDVFNEADAAARVAAHLGAEHIELYVTPEETTSVIPLLPALYDEPFSDSSQIPTFLVSKLAREHVTVCLSGDGGDELFGGYNRYFWWERIWKYFGWMNGGVRNALSDLFSSVSPGKWERIFRFAGALAPSLSNLRLPVDKIYKFADLLRFKDRFSLYLRLVSHWNDPESIIPGAIEPSTIVSDHSAWPGLYDLTLEMMYLDMLTYLPDDILTKVDRASMGVSLESRIPLLDPQVVEFAWQVPLSMKIRNGQGKWLLRQVLYRYLPKSLIERPKMGFAVPIDLWLRGPLREWAGDLLSERSLAKHGFFNPVPIMKKWEEHQRGIRNWQYHLWDILIFQTWFDSVHK